MPSPSSKPPQPQPQPEVDTTGEKPLELGNDTFLFRGKTPTSPLVQHHGPSPPPPALVVLCTWLGGATTRRVHKYVAGYWARWPSTAVLLIRTLFPDLAVRSFASLRARLQPARDAIDSVLAPLLTDKDRKEDVLLHVFSNGGSSMATQLLNSSLPSALRDRLGLVVFDCCPGGASFIKAYGAALLSLPPSLSPPLRWLGTAATYFCASAIQAL